jgi:hypothetical protein
MRDRDLANSYEEARQSCELLLQSNGLTLGPRQRERVTWLIGHAGRAVIWDGRLPSPSSGAIIVTEAPTGPIAEAFCRSLASDAVVIIPYGQLPNFDFLKSKLIGYGTVGSAGHEGPHELWWGGLDWQRFQPPQVATEQPLVISCYWDDAQEDDAARLRRSLADVGLSYEIRRLEPPAHGQSNSMQKTDFIRDVYDQVDCPILYLNPTSAVRALPRLPIDIDCDFAIHKWRSWEFAGGTVYFGRSNAARALLQTWCQLCADWPGIWDPYLLDQAWTLVSSQRELDSVWLPRSYHMPFDARPQNENSVIVQDVSLGAIELGPGLALSAALKTARRASRSCPPEPHLVIATACGGHRPISVIMQDSGRLGARALATAIEAVAHAFASNPGIYSQLELSVCRWQSDIDAVLSAVSREPLMVTSPLERFSSDTFPKFGGR